jgi:PmbA protein
LDTFPEKDNRFPLAPAELRSISQIVLKRARDGGATAAETEVAQAFGQSVSVRKGEVETI